MRPTLSYTIWFTQRTGSTLLCKTLEDTGIAGKPNEWLFNTQNLDLLEYYGFTNHTDLENHLWDLGSTPNGVFGVKVGLFEPNFSRVLDTLRKFPDCPQVELPRAEVWQYAFPNCRHIFMTRRNKIRLAVSWWKAIRSNEWHRKTGENPSIEHLENEYNFNGIYYLFSECSSREAQTQEFFSESGITPLTIVYEDFINNYEKTIRNVLDFLELDSTHVAITKPYYSRLADELSNQWVERFQNELQTYWQIMGWH